MKDGKWLDLAESLALVGSGLGTIASIASQQLAFTAAPVSCLLLLNIANRRRLDQETLESTATSITHLDQRLSEDIKMLNQQVRALPSFIDLANVQKTVQHRHDTAISQLHHTVSSRLSAIEKQDFEQFEQELTYLKTKYSQLSESMATVSQHLNRFVTTHRIEGAESAIAALRKEVTQLESKLTNVASNQKLAIPRALQDEIYQLHRRLNSLPLPFDATALKQEVDGLVKVVGDLVSRRELAKLMAEIEKIRQQHQTLEQTVAPMRSVNAIMRKQLDTLSTWITAGHPGSSKREIEKLQTAIAELQARLATVTDGAEFKRLHTEMQMVLDEHLGQLQARFERVQQHTQNLDHQQKQIADWMDRLPDLLNASALQNQIKYLTSRLEGTESQLTALMQRSPTEPAQSDYELMFHLPPAQAESGATTRAVLQAALHSAQARVIVVFPYPDRTTLNPNLLQSFRAFLDRGGRLDLGWGLLSNGQAMQQARFVLDREALSLAKTALKQILQPLMQLKRGYPEQFRFKVLGTNENFLVCDAAYGVLGMHPIATASAAFPEVALGIRTQNQTVIQGLIERFDQPALDSDDLTAHLNRALTRHELGDRQGAIADYSAVLEIDASHYVAMNNRALIQLELGNYAEAIADLNRAVSHHSGNCIAYCNRGVIWSRMGQYHPAIADFSAAIQVDPACKPAYLQRGLAQMKSENMSDAIGDFTTVIGLDANHAVAYFHRGLAYSTTRDKLAALRDLREAARLFAQQGEPAKHQQASAAIQKLRKQFGETSGLKLVRKA